MLLFQLIPRRSWIARRKTVVITGASSGIGAAIARQYAKQGANLWLVARRKSNLERICVACQNLGAASARAVIADVATETGWEALRTAVEPDAVDLLVLNAGLAMGAPFTTLSSRGEAMPIMKRLMDVNYIGAVGCFDACWGALRRAPDGVRLLVVSSVVGLVAPPSRTGYAASKFALKGFFDALRIELHSSERVRPTVTVAYPGAVRTEINQTRLVGSVDNSKGGSSGAVDISMDHNRSMSAEQCAEIMVRAHARGDRAVLYSIDGTFIGSVKSRLLLYLSFFFPGIADSALMATMRAMSTKRN